MMMYFNLLLMIGNEKEDLTQAQLDERIGELEQRLKVCIRAR